jgi:hypothetical protein
MDFYKKTCYEKCEIKFQNNLFISDILLQIIPTLRQ